MARETKARKAAKKRPAKETSPQPASVVERIASEADRAAYIRVLQARSTGGNSTQTDIRAAKRYDDAERLRVGLLFVAAVDKNLLCKWGEVQHKQVDDAAERYGLPAKGATWSVPEVCHWLFRFLAKYGRHLKKRENETDPLLVGPNSPWLDLYRKERTLVVRVQRRELEKSMIPVAMVREALQRAGEQLRQAAVLLKQDCDPRALEIYNEGLDGYDGALDRFFDAVSEKFAEDEALPAGHGVDDGERPGAAEADDA